MSTDSIITVSIIGLYTIVNVVVFFIQKSQINRQKEIIASMESFMRIFSVDEVVKYNNMREETVKGNLKNYLQKDENTKKIIEDISKNTIGPIKDYYMSVMGDRFRELFHFAVEVIKVLPKKKQDLLLANLKNNREFIEKAIRDVNNNNV